MKYCTSLFEIKAEKCALIVSSLTALLQYHKELICIYEITLFFLEMELC